MTLAPGTRLGPYEVLSPIGAGGMGEVYKASDTRLNRVVAIKVLPPHFAHDPDMKQRFDREAQTIAGLNHPNICTLHDVGRLRPEGASASQNEVSYLVMEYVEGETLADRLQSGPLSIDEALMVAGEIADALDRAHRQGVIHRDLKPANIMLAKGETTRPASSPAHVDAALDTQIGSSPAIRAGSSSRSRLSSSHTARPGAARTKLLDFGLAKWTNPEAQALGAQPTRMDVTAQGTVLGTLQYMAPEQVEGKEADARTDIFAFGAVLYEMLTGKKAFEGRSQASLIGAIMKAEPRPISHNQPQAPAVLEHLVARCLVKDPDERWQDAHSLKVKLAWIARNRNLAPSAVEAPRKRWIDVAVMTALGVLLAAVAVPAYLYWRGPADPEAIQFRHTITGLSESDIAVSPDGKTIAFVARPDSAGAPSLYVRPVGDVTSVKLAGTDNAAQPFWSPDSQSIAYIAGSSLRRVAAVGGATKALCDAPDFAGGAWSEADGGTIVFGSPHGLLSVSAEGGKAQPVTELGQGEAGHFWPSFLPDGRHVAFLVWTTDAAKRAIAVAAPGSKERTHLVAAESNPVYADSGSRQAAPGYLFYHRGATLFAQPFDAKGLRFTGDPVQLAGELATSPYGRSSYSVSRTGVLIYFQGSGTSASTGRGRTGQSQFAWIDRAGSRGGNALDGGNYGDMDLSPDARSIAITKQDPGAPTADIWVIEWEKARPFRLTSGVGDSVDPVWSPDGEWIAFTSWRKDNADIYIKRSNAVGAETPLVESAVNESVEDWSRDGKYIAFKYGKDAFPDIYALPLDADRKPGKPFPVVQGRYQKDEPQFSKDGKWLAYVSDENEPGQFQVYVMSFPAGDLRQQVSTDGGGQPRWDWNNKVLYYRTLDHRYMAVDLTLGAKIEAGAPRSIGASGTTVPSSGDPTRHMWSVARDGRHLQRVAVGSQTGAGSGTAPLVAPQFTPSGQGSTAAASRNSTVSGLTAILHWTSATQKADK